MLDAGNGLWALGRGHRLMAIFPSSVSANITISMIDAHDSPIDA